MSQVHKEKNNAHLEHGDKRYNDEKGYSKEGGNDFGEKIEKNQKSGNKKSRSKK